MIDKSRLIHYGGRSFMLAAAMAFSLYANPANSDGIENSGRDLPFVVIDEITGEEIDITSIPFWNDLTREKEGILHSRTNIPKSIDDKVQELILDLTTNRGNVIALNNTFSRAKQYRDYVEQAYNITGIEKNTILALMATESNGYLRNGSEKGAKGLMQLMPETARNMKLRVDNFIDERMHPKSIISATHYFKEQVDKYGNELLALAAYNDGPGDVDKRVEEHGKEIESLWPHLPTETQKFIVRVLARRAILDNPLTYGIEITPQPLFSNNLANAQIYKVEKGDNFIGIARKRGVSGDEIKYLNPDIVSIDKINIGQNIYVPKKAVIR